MTRYKAVLSKMYRRLGRGITTDRQLSRVGRSIFGSDYLGTFAQDSFPKTSIKSNQPTYFIINVDKRDKPGTHWVAIYWSGTKFHIYDSFGRSSRKLLPHFVKTIGYKFADADPDAEQARKEYSCGSRSMAWLQFVRDNSIQEAMKI